MWSARALAAAMIVLSITGCSLLNPSRDIEREYTVRPGDSASEIAGRFGVSVSALAKANSLKDPGRLKVGQVLRIPEATGEESVRAMMRGGRSDSREEGRFISLGRAKRYVGLLAWPVSDAGVNSRFGNRWLSFHEGLDIKADEGTPVLAAHDGKVVYEGEGFSGYGNMVVLKTDDLMTVYAHNRSNKVSLGDKVDKGDVIGYSGSTGTATGAHLHFETRVKDDQGKFVAVDPLVFFRDRARESENLGSGD